MTLNVFYVRADDANGEDLGLLVRAHDKADVLAIWHDYFEIGPVAVPTWIGQVPGVVADGEAGAIDWESIKLPGVDGTPVPTEPVVYFIWADVDGQNQDLMVRAIAPEEAEAIWRAAYSLEDSAELSGIGVIPCVRCIPGSKGTEVSGQIGQYIDWGSITPSKV